MVGDGHAIHKTIVALFLFVLVAAANVMIVAYERGNKNKTVFGQLR